MLIWIRLLPSVHGGYVNKLVSRKGEGDEVGVKANFRPPISDYVKDRGSERKRARKREGERGKESENE